MNSTRRLFIIAGTFTLTLLSVHFFGSSGDMRGPRIREVLPDWVGNWQGTDIFYCQTETCMATFVQSALTNTTTCPTCMGVLDRVSLGENRILPADTVIVRKQYHSDIGSISVSVVVTGMERSSIHRPQWCLPGQGLRIESEQPDTIVLQGREPLRVMRLHLTRSKRSSPQTPDLSYIYWFVGEKRETRYHVERLFWMAWENLFHNIRYRWTYIAVAFMPSRSGTGQSDSLDRFIADLYPMIDRMVPLQVLLDRPAPIPLSIEESDDIRAEEAEDFLDREISNMVL